MYTLAHAYFSEFEEVPNVRELPEDERPIGALLLSLQAVCTAYFSIYHHLSWYS